MTANSTPDQLALLQRTLELERQARENAERQLRSRTEQLNLARSQLEDNLALVKARAAELELLHEIAFYTQQDPDTPTILRAFVRAVCNRCGWPCGHVFFPGDDGADADRLFSSDIWETSEDFDPELLVGACADLSFGSGEGVPGRAFAEGIAVYQENIDDRSDNPRADIYAELGLKTSFALPIRAFGRIVAVTEFFSAECMTRDEKFLRNVETAALQLGTGIDRRESEVQLRQNISRLEQANHDLRAAKDQLVQSEKLSSIGQLAAGIAHEINNPIGFVMSNVNSLRDYLQTLVDMVGCYRSFSEAVGTGDDNRAAAAMDVIREKSSSEDLEFVMEDAADIIEESVQGMLRVKDIVEGLKTFARTDGSTLAEADINHVIDVSLKMVWNELKYTCEIDKDFGELPFVVCNAGKLGQVFTNLFVNASHAIGEQGRIAISTRREGDGVRIVVRDNGHGIPADKVKEIFNPFFTTKPVGQGTGLGLSVSYGIIQEHGGTIEVDSEIGVGTAFTITLPGEPPKPRAVDDAA
ncbi:MAG: ATP-binding protein [Gammaproteobacteria bacterium]